MSTTPFLVIAHRGASDYAPENTVAAFDLAIELGARHIELDVELSSDVHIVVIHDDTLDRTTNASGPVTDRTLADLRRLDAGSWFGARYSGERIPVYTDVLKRYRGRAHLHTEIKGRSPVLVQRVADVVRTRCMQEQVTITSFLREQLEEIRASAPELATGWLVEQVTDEVVAEAHALGLRQVCPRADGLTPELVSRLHGEGFVVRAWGVSSDELMTRVVASGADGATVNWPDRLLTYLAEQGREAG